MEGRFLDWLDKVAPGLSLFLAIVIVCGGAVLSCYRVLKREIKKHDDEITERIKENNSEEEFKNQMKELAERGHIIPFAEYLRVLENELDMNAEFKYVISKSETCFVRDYTAKLSTTANLFSC